MTNSPYKDKNWNIIKEWDTFKWFLPEWFQTHFSNSYLDPMASIFWVNPWCLEYDFEEIAKVEKRWDKWILVGTGYNEWYESDLDWEFPDGSFRYEKWEVISPNAIIETTDNIHYNVFFNPPKND